MLKVSEKNKRPISLLQAHFLPFFLILSSFGVLLGWFSGHAAWIRVHENLPVIPILTTVNFLVLGIVLESLMLGRLQSSLFRYVRPALSVFFLWLFLTTGYVVLRFLFSWNFNLEAAFWPDLQNEMAGHVGLMSLASASCFLTTTFLLFAKFRKWKIKKFEVILNFIPILLSSAVLIAYVYQTSEIYGFYLFKNTSVITAAVFLIFHLFWIFNFSTEDGSVQFDAVDKTLYASFAIILLTFALLGIISSRSLTILIGTHQSQVRIQEKIKDYQEILVNLLNVETGGRGFAITGEKKYLEPFELGKVRYTESIEDLKKNGDLNSNELEKIQEIQKLAQAKIENAEAVILTREKHGLSLTVSFVKADIGKNLMDQIRVLVDQLTREQLTILKTQNVTSQNRANFTLMSLVGGSLIATFVLMVCFVFYRRNERLRHQAEGEIKILNLSLSEKLKETETLNKELESFSYSVSHDLRAPLRAMSGFGEILLEDLGGRVEKNELDYLKRIVTASEKMSKLIDGILVLSRLTRTQPKKIDINLYKIASELASDFEIADGKRTFKLKFNAGHIAWADETLIILLLQNLIGNAWKFTSKVKNPEIEVGSLEKEGQLVFYVKDNGAGFNMKYYNKLFGTFQRLHFDSEFQGTGIGLATSRRIVSMHNGEIWAEAEENTGATFYFYLSPKGDST